MNSRHYFISILFTAFIIAAGYSCQAQNDTIKRPGLDSFLLNQKGIIGKLAHNLITDTTSPDASKFQRSDQPFQWYAGRIIRRIIIRTLDFGVSIGDTTRRLNNSLTHLANNLHRKTRDFVISNNLFFRENQRLSPYLFGDNERHLRDLPYIKDAKISVVAVMGSRDSVDVLVEAKDVLSIGGNLEIHNTSSYAVGLKEDNFMGWGDRLQLETLYDHDRNYPFAYGLSYIRRNIGGTFIDGELGFLNFSKSFSSYKGEEQAAYLRFIKPLINPYMHWTYGLEAGVHSMNNMYAHDSVFEKYYNYKYSNIDLWGEWNINSDNIDGNNEDKRLRRYVGLRILQQRFSEKPSVYLDQYYYKYADIKGVLGDISLFKQNFYKTQYIYGFGRNEDVPEGSETSLTAGWTREDKRNRPYAAINYQRYFFTGNQQYFNYTFRAGSFFYKQHFEDINVLANLDYFSALHDWSRKWKQRTFLSASIGKQFNVLLNEPLMLESDYGLPDFNNNNLGGDMRITLKSESVFFSPWSILLFRFAPFAFANASVFRLQTGNKFDARLYSSLGGGIRVRNESLIFGTIELKGYYFPRKNFYNKGWRVDFNTNIRFKYNQDLIKRADFIQIN